MWIKCTKQLTSTHLSCYGDQWWWRVGNSIFLMTGLSSCSRTSYTASFSVVNEQESNFFKLLARVGWLSASSPTVSSLWRLVWTPSDPLIIIISCISYFTPSCAFSSNCSWFHERPVSKTKVEKIARENQYWPLAPLHALVHAYTYMCVRAYTFKCTLTQTHS